ncbi:HotDog domain-containing protein [Vararia minispora EC-137]|uniref:HotDog domain-containing protein n=1 Tax=Vararia minispora EC-137 TaxID=1314806 RepID=A0ACB8QRN8_9AGAM|nr:HotDog domain-containing protein [Vararia minispora EC-137]
MPASAPAGSASDEVKQMVIGLFDLIKGTKRGFIPDITARIQVTEVSVATKAGSSKRMEWIVVCEMDCLQDMSNIANALHGGASAYLVDICSSLVLAAAGRPNTVSQAINMIYHAPAPVGHHLRIVNRTMTVGSRILSARTEIWDATDDRLCVTGTHIKMEPSSPKL